MVVFHEEDDVVGTICEVCHHWAGCHQMRIEVELEPGLGEPNTMGILVTLLQVRLSGERSIICGGGNNSALIGLSGRILNGLKWL